MTTDVAPPALDEAPQAPGTGVAEGTAAVPLSAVERLITRKALNSYLDRLEKIGKNLRECGPGQTRGQLLYRCWWLRGAQRVQGEDR